MKPLNPRQRALIAAIDSGTVANGDTLHAYSGRDFCAAWDTGARLGGNPDA